ncbi:MAG: glycosyltransferase, partial [Clostridia bacterium]|nr:glycosyltransferase [Clostridia bacterium]
YRVPFMNLLGEKYDLTLVLTESNEIQAEKESREKSWFYRGERTYRAEVLPCRKILGKYVCFAVLSYLKHHSFDLVFFDMYGTPSVSLALLWLIVRRKPYCLSIDGGLISPNGFLVKKLKKTFLRHAELLLSPGTAGDDFLLYYGAEPEKIRRYPFTSVKRDYLLSSPLSEEEKREKKKALGMPEEKAVLTVGRFIPLKRFDTLLKAAKSLPDSVGIYFIGGEPTEEYVELAREAGAGRVHFLGFMNQNDLKEYYMAADVFTMTTESDVWGLVVNEAMACGLPVVSTDKCVAGVCLIRDGVNGYLVPVGDETVLADRLKKCLFGVGSRQMAEESLKTIAGHTVENMAARTIEVLAECETRLGL